MNTQNHHVRSSICPGASREKRRPVILTAAVAALVSASPWLPASAQLTLSGTSYTETFDGIAGGLPTGWTVRRNATASSLGTSVSYSTGHTSWNTTSGGFYNFASAQGADSASTTDRALGTRQSSNATTGGDPGAAFTLQLANTSGLDNFSLSFSAQMLSMQTRSTIWTLQYGLGDTPGEFVDLATYNDPGAFGSTTINASAALAGIADQDQTVWIRIVALSASVGSGSRDSFGIDDFSLTWSAAVAPLFWAPGGSIGGGGVWSGSNWNTSNDATGTQQAFNPASKAVFDGMGGTVQLAAGGVTVNNGIEFASAGYTIAANAGDKLTLAENPVIQAEAAAKISAEITGVDGLTKSGADVLELTADNSTLQGTITIASGALLVSADNNLGAAANPIVLSSGSLKTENNLTLNAARNVSGTGGFDIAPSTTLTVAGAANLGSVTLHNSGELKFTGASASIGGLSINSAATITNELAGGAVMGITGNITTANEDGTVVFNGPIDMGAGNRNHSFSDGLADEDAIFNGAITSTGRIQFSGLPTAVIRLNGDNSGMNGMRLDAGGPTLVIGHELALSDTQMFFNGGTLSIPTALTIPTPLSIGGAVEIRGTSATFSGDVSVFGAGAKPISIPGTIAFSGSFGAGEYELVGGGTMNLTNEAAVHAGSFKVTDGTLNLKGAINGNLTVGSEFGGSTAVFALSPDEISNSGTLTGLSLLLDGVVKLEIDSDLGLSDSLVSNGIVDLGEGIASLDLIDLGSTTLAFGTTFTLLDYQGFGSVAGFFKDLPNLATFTVGSNQFQISYGTEDGSGTLVNPDVVLQVVPEPSSAVLIIAAGALIGGMRRRRVA